jgi:hypothetical protein
MDAPVTICLIFLYSLYLEQPWNNKELQPKYAQERVYVSMYSVRYFCPVLTKTDNCQYHVLKFSDIKLNSKSVQLFYTHKWKDRKPGEVILMGAVVL